MPEPNLKSSLEVQVVHDNFSLWRGRGRGWGKQIGTHFLNTVTVPCFSETNGFFLNAILAGQTKISMFLDCLLTNYVIVIALFH